MFCEYKVFVKVVEESDNPSTIRFLQGIASPDLIVFYEVYHFGSPPTVLVRVFGLLKHSSSFDVVLVSL